jgi:hypothetical protein
MPKPFEPSAEEIRATCRAIQDDWNPREEQVRRGVDPDAVFCIPGADGAGLATGFRVCEMGALCGGPIRQ